MKSKNFINSILGTVGLLVTVFAIVMSTLMAAHANMADSVMPDHQMDAQEMRSDKSGSVVFMPAMNMACAISTDSMDSSHKGAECCVAMCGAAVLNDVPVLSDKEDTHTHIALFVSQMTSADSARLMRPPSH